MLLITKELTSDAKAAGVQFHILLGLMNVNLIQTDLVTIHMN